MKFPHLRLHRSARTAAGAVLALLATLAARVAGVAGRPHVAILAGDLGWSDPGAKNDLAQPLPERVEGLRKRLHA